MVSLIDNFSKKTRIKQNLTIRLVTKIKSIHLTTNSLMETSSLPNAPYQLYQFHNLQTKTIQIFHRNQLNKLPQMSRFTFTIKRNFLEWVMEESKI